MRGLPRPDIRLAFLRSEQIIEQLNHLERQLGDGDTDEDEDGVEVEGIRDEFRGGERVPAEHNSSSAEESIFGAFDSDDSQLSEYQDRRRLRREERDHERQEQRLDILRRSLRIEQTAFRKSIPRGAYREDPIEDDEGGEGDTQVGGHKDLHDTMRRYGERLAQIDEKQRRHARMAERLNERRSLSVRQARERQRQQEIERRLLEARTRAEERERRRLRERRRAERVRRAQEEERVRVRVEAARRARAMAEEREQAIREEEILTRQQRDWLVFARNQGRTEPLGRRILGELNISRYPGAR